MTPVQALQFLKQILVLRPGVSLDDAAGVVEAWNVLAKAVEQIVKEREERGHLPKVSEVGNGKNAIQSDV
jgi:hypothetical protein